MFILDKLFYVPTSDAVTKTVSCLKIEKNAIKQNIELLECLTQFFSRFHNDYSFSHCYISYLFVCICDAPTKHNAGLCDDFVCTHNKWIIEKRIKTLNRPNQKKTRQRKKISTENG